MEDSINIIEIIKKCWKERILIFKTSILFFLTGCLIALLSPVVYNSHTTFVPQVSGDEISSANNKLGSLASLAGVNIKQNEMTADSYLSPLLYKNILDSEEFSLELFNEELINLNAENFTIREYLLSKRNSFNFNPFVIFKKFLNSLFFDNESVDINSDIFKKYNFINEEDYNLIGLFRSKFMVELNEKEGYIKVIASDNNAFISSQLVEKITKNLQSKIIEIRTNKIRERLLFSKEQYNLKQLEFDSLQKKLAEFKDSNKNISTASFGAELQKLESEFQLQQNILINLASEFNNNKIKLNKDTPIFSVIDDVTIPNTRSKPKRSAIVLIFLFIGIFLSVTYIFTKELIFNIIKEVKN